MSVTGKIKNGVVVLPPGTRLPEGAEVKVETLLTAAEDPLVAIVEKLPKLRPHLPMDYALNHGHQVRLPVFNGDGLQPGVNLDDSRATRRLLDESGKLPQLP